MVEMETSWWCERETLARGMRLNSSTIRTGKEMAVNDNNNIMAINSTVQLDTRDLRSYCGKGAGEGTPPNKGGMACDSTDHRHRK